MDGEPLYCRRTSLECVRQPPGYSEISVDVLYEVLDLPKRTEEVNSSYLLTMQGDSDFEIELERELVEDSDFFRRYGL